VPQIVASDSPPGEHATAYKASVVRGYAAVLRREGLLEPVCARVSPEVEQLLRHPPPATAWVDGRLTEQITLAVADVGGATAPRRLLRLASQESLIPLMMPLIKGLLRVFGVTPHTLYKRLNDTLKFSNRGCEASYRVEGVRAGTVRYRMLYRRNVPIAVFHGVAGGLEAVLAICDVMGTVSEPRVVDDGKGNAADYAVAW
jgi:hypothetical protein